MYSNCIAKTTQTAYRTWLERSNGARKGVVVTSEVSYVTKSIVHPGLRPLSFEGINFARDLFLGP